MGCRCVLVTSIKSKHATKIEKKTLTQTCQVVKGLGNRAGKAHCCSQDQVARIVLFHLLQNLPTVFLTYATSIDCELHTRLARRESSVRSALELNTSSWSEDILTHSGRNFPSEFDFAVQPSRVVVLRGFSINQNGQGASWAIFHFIQPFSVPSVSGNKEKRENCQKNTCKTAKPGRNSTDKRVVLQTRSSWVIFRWNSPRKVVACARCSLVSCESSSQ